MSEGHGNGSDVIDRELGFNVTLILQHLQNLSEEQIEHLIRDLGISTEKELYDLLAQYKMHVKSYEQGLMQYPEYRAHKLLLLYVPPILVILGTFGNIFSFIILKRKAMLKFSTYFYLMVLAVADNLVLYIGLLRLWIGELTGYDLRDQAAWLCKLTNVLGYTVSDFSVWLIIAVTVERYIVVCHPLKANSFCNTLRARKIILSMLFILLVINLHFFWTVTIVFYQHNGEDIPRCSGGPKESYEYLVDSVWPWVDVFIYSFLPFLIITVLNMLIIRQVILAHKSRNAMLQPGSIYEQRRPSHEGSTRLTVMLLTISFAFLLTTLPMNIVNITARFMNKYVKDLSIVSKFSLARSITEMLMYFNHSMNFFLYCAAGQKFRHQLVWMMCYAKRTYNFTWGSETASQGTRLESVRNMKSLRRVDATEMYATIKSEMYTPLKAHV